jgi:hypothetical protein
MEINVMEEIYSFKTMLRMLYQAGVIILRQFKDELMVPVASFPLPGHILPDAY